MCLLIYSTCSLFFTWNNSFLGATRINGNYTLLVKILWTHSCPSSLCCQAHQQSSYQQRLLVIKSCCAGVRNPELIVLILQISVENTLKNKYWQLWNMRGRKSHDSWSWACRWHWDGDTAETLQVEERCWLEGNRFDSQPRASSPFFTRAVK